VCRWVHAVTAAAAAAACGFFTRLGSSSARCIAEHLCVVCRQQLSVVVTAVCDQHPSIELKEGGITFQAVANRSFDWQIYCTTTEWTDDCLTGRQLLTVQSVATYQRQIALDK